MRNSSAFRLRSVLGALALLLAGMGVAGMSANSSTPSAAPVIAAGEVSSVTASTLRCLQIVVSVEHYEEYQEMLNPNDLLLAKAARVIDPATGEFYFSEAEYQEAKSWLMELQNVPVRKGIVFSSYEDLGYKIDDIRPYVDLVAYNTEGGMTPIEELSYQLADYVTMFAQLARSRGLAVGWGPTSADLSRRPELLELASEVDRIGLQHQNVLARQGVEETVSLTKERSLEIRGFNPNIEINLQLKGELEEIEDVLLQTVDYVDAVLILTKYGAPFDYQQLFNDLDLRSECTGQPLLTAPTVPPPSFAGAQTPVPSPTPGSRGGISPPCLGGVGLGLLLLMALSGWTLRRRGT